GFVLACNLPILASGSIEPLLTVRTADGEFGHRPLRFDIPPQEVGVRVFDPMDKDAAGKRGDYTAPMQLFIEDAVVDAGGILRVGGWVVCLVQIESVEAFVDGASIGKAEFGRVRDDVGKKHPDYPNSRFSG